MRYIYVNLPHYEAIAEELNKHFTLCDKKDAHAIVTEFPDEYTPSSFVILIKDKNPYNGSFFIDNSQELETIQISVKSSLDTFFMTRLVGQYSPYIERDGGLSKITYFLKKLENILNASPESIVEIDLSGNIFFYNKKFAKICQEEDVLLEKNIFDIFDKGTTLEVKRAMGSALQGKDANFYGKLLNKKGESISIAGHVASLGDDSYNFEIIFDDITTKISKLLQMRQIEEQSIIAGFSRHLSHNIMNALTAAGGFIRQIKARTEFDEHSKNLWQIIDNKLLLIEEIIAGYNDYTYAISFNLTDNIDINEFFSQLIISLSEKNIDRNFTAYLYKFTASYKLEYDFSGSKSFNLLCNKMFLKLAICYILKDNIRYFSSGKTLQFKIKLLTDNDLFTIAIDLLDVDAPDYIIDSMFSPWRHNMLAQSFDYWGIVIAGAIVERHHGKARVERIENGTEKGLKFCLEFKKSFS